MIRVSVLYPNGVDCHFNMEYYIHKHIPMIQSMLKDLGLKKIEVDEGFASGAPDQPAPYGVVCHMFFDSLEDIRAK